MAVAPVPVRDAATVMLLRDRDSLEVCMLRRNPRSVFAGGAYVFPGGAVDEQDRQHPVGTGRTDAEASAILGIARGGLAFWSAAVRECFEETGILLATGTLADKDARRDDLNAGRALFGDVAAGVVVDLAAIHYFAHWITPLGAPRRYDTRFFVAAAPPGQEPVHDDAEIVDALWVRPVDALAKGERGDYELIEPTLRTLSALALFDSSAEVLDVAANASEMEPDGLGLRIRLGRSA